MSWIIVAVIVVTVMLVNYYISHSNNIIAEEHNCAPNLQKIGYIETPLDDYVVIDLETTGLAPTRDHIVQVAAVHYVNHKEVDSFCTYVKPPCHIPEQVVKIHGISDQIVTHAPTIYEIRDEFTSFISSHIIVGYNVQFDLNFLNAAYGKSYDSNFEILDVLKYARKSIPNMPNYKLETISAAVGYNGRSHDALSDCRATAAVLKFLCIPPDGYEAEPPAPVEPPRPTTTMPDRPTTPFRGHRVIVVGTLARYQQFEITAILTMLGAEVGTNLTRNTDFVIVGSEPGAKYTRAKKLIEEGCPIKLIMEDELMTLFEALPQGFIQVTLDKWKQSTQT